MTTQPNSATTALVIGINGSFGGAVARELASRGVALRALVRDIPKARRNLGAWADDAAIEFVLGDALVSADVSQAAQGATALVYGFNVPYPQWDPVAIQAAETVFPVAAALRMTVLFPGNVYGLGRGRGQGPMDESTPLVDATSKAAIRNRIEGLLEQATGGGARAVVVRAGDYFGPDCLGDSSWFNHLVRPALKGGAITYGGGDGVDHAFAYLPDVARIAADLLARSSELRPYEVFHFAGQVVNRESFGAGVRQALGAPNRGLKTMPWGVMRLAWPFSSMLRQLFEMRYLWNEEVLMDDGKLRSVLGERANVATPFAEAAATTIAALRSAQAVSANVA